jgi:hypothetical protein
MKEIIEILLNGMSTTYFWAMFIMAFLGVIVMFTTDVIKAVKTDNTTPDKFSWKYMLITGAARIIAGLIILCVTIIYFGELSKMVFKIEIPLVMNGAVAFFIGIGIDAIVKKVVSFGKFSFNKITGK